jgi:diguanylate cyclase (GGDEF)-like protein/PAS domain S-box-containing protein
MRFPNNIQMIHLSSGQSAVWLVALSSLLFLFVWIMHFSHPFENITYYMPLHTILETVSIVISVLIYSVGWNAYALSRARKIVFISCAFFSVAVLDLGHFMTYVGMPEFVSHNTQAQSTTFWLAARFIAALTVLLSIVIGWKPFRTARSRYFIALFYAAYVCIVYWFVLFDTTVLNKIFSTENHLFQYVALAEYSILLTMVISVSLLLFFIRKGVFNSEYTKNVLIATFIMMLSELCLTLTTSSSDSLNLLGHLYKILAYTFFYKAIFMISVRLPFEKLKLSQELVFAEKELAQVTLNSIGDGVVTTDVYGHVKFLNPIAEKLTGWSQEEAAGLPLDEVFSIVNQETRKPIENPAYRAISEGVIVELSNHSLLISKDGQEYSIEDCAAPILNSKGKILGCVLVFHNITEKYLLMEHISWQAGHDTLTGLPNRTLLSDRIAQGTAHAERQEQLLIVCFMDLDGFKAVNDKHGHELGDKLLIEVAHRLLNVVRGGDTVSRLGGDEFVLLLNNLGSADEADILLRRILDEMARPFMIEQEVLIISASIGATIFPFDSSDTDTLLRHADQAMYQAKQSGRNRYHLFDASMDLHVHERHQQNIRLQLALAQGELRLLYQPKVNLKTAKIIGMEALLRWNHPELGLRLPLDFLYLAEDSNLIVEIGNWVLDQALCQLSLWHEAGYDWHVSVNIAARQLQRHDFMSNLKNILAKYPNAPASKLELEILESTALDDMDHVRSIILACQEMGIRISLDDFGSGYSSLAYLRLLPANSLKIDQSFVRDMLEDEEDCALVEGILQMARVFKREVIAEGMETAAHGALLLNLGCNNAQGYGIAYPMAADEMPEWAKNFKPDPLWQNYPAVLVGWGRSTSESEKPQSELYLE